MRELYTEISQIMEQEQYESVPFIASEVVVKGEIYEQNKRIVMAYCHERLQRLQHLYHLYSANISEHHLSHCNTTEQTFLQEYHQLQTQYEKEMDFSLGTGLELDPPKSKYVRVRVLKNAGKIITMESGTLSLTENSVYYMAREDANQLLRDNIVQIL